VKAPLAVCIRASLQVQLQRFRLSLVQVQASHRVRLQAPRPARHQVLHQVLHRARVQVIHPAIHPVRPLVTAPVVHHQDRRQLDRRPPRVLNQVVLLVTHQATHQAVRQV